VAFKDAAAGAAVRGATDHGAAVKRSNLGRAKATVGGRRMTTALADLEEALTDVVDPRLSINGRLDPATVSGPMLPAWR
jgi:hypothetical protein